MNRLNIHPELTSKLQNIAMHSSYANFSDSFMDACSDLKYTLHVINAGRGFCRYSTRLLTVPVWAMKHSDNEYPIYYLSHELAHAFTEHSSKGHDATFMACFKEICPIHLQHYELEYKPKAALLAGMPMPPDF